MNKYELTVVVSAKLDDEGRAAELEKVKALVEKSLDTLEECGVLKRDRATVLAEVLEFFKQRENNIFTDMKYSKDIVAAVLDSNSDNVIEALEKVKTLQEFVKDEAFETLLPIIKRVGNISKDHEKGIINPDLFKVPVEEELYNFSLELNGKVIDALNNKDYRKYLNEIVLGKDIINRYFNEVMVMDKDEAIKENRLSQLKFLADLFVKMADLNQIEER